MIALIVVRGGALPAGAEECIAEAGGRGLVIGTDVEAVELAGDVTLIETGPFAPGAYAAIAAEIMAAQMIDETVVLPGSADGRDLAPRLAFALGRPLLAPAVEVGEREAVVERCDGRVTEVIATTGPFVATLIPGVRGVGRAERAVIGSRRVLQHTPDPLAAGSRQDPVSIELLPPDPSTMDLVEAPRIVAGGQGLGSSERFEQLARIGLALGASLGGTRVASDAGWIPFERQIGTTGVAVDPRVYLAFAISGATQHTSGLGAPKHIISVNTDPSCPMMAMADLAIVSDAIAVLDALERKLDALAAKRKDPVRA